MSKPLWQSRDTLAAKMLEHYSHIRMEAKLAALDAIAAQPSQGVFEAGVNQNVNQLTGRKSSVVPTLNGGPGWT
jgi:hypothetical protein